MKVIRVMKRLRVYVCPLTYWPAYKQWKVFIGSVRIIIEAGPLTIEFDRRKYDG
jgi:hypothetical protein